MKHKFIRWSQESACYEWGINRRTLSGRIKRGHIQPGKDGKFSTAQIDAAIHGSAEDEKLKKLTAEREILEIELGKLRGDVVLLDHVYRILDNITISIRQTIAASGMSDTEKQQCLKQLRTPNAAEFIEGEALADPREDSKPVSIT